MQVLPAIKNSGGKSGRGAKRAWGAPGGYVYCVLLSNLFIFVTSKFTCKFTSKILLVNLGKITSWETRKKTLCQRGIEFVREGLDGRDLGQEDPSEDALAHEKKIRKQILDLKKYIEKNCKNVGDNFSREARNIHYDKKTSKGIYGKATPEETAELLEEGIDVATIPWPNNSEN